MANVILIEKGDDMKYRATIRGAHRATAIGDTQKETAEAAKKIHPDAKLLGERQRNTDRGSRDKWRRIY